MPIPSLQLQKTMCLMQRSRGFGHGVVVSKTMQWLCSQLCYVTAANKRTIVEIELLAIVGWKCGCEPFSCRCWQNVTCCRKETCGTCLFKTSITAIPFGNSSMHSLPEASCYWVRQHAPTVRGCVMPIPSLQLYEKAASWREVEGLVTELWSPRFVTMQWLCSQLCYLTAANQRAIFAIELLATVGWKWGCQPFSCRCSQNVTHCRKEICSTCLFKASIPAIPFGISIIHSLPEGGVRSTCSALWLHHAHPFVAATEKNVSHAEKQRVWSRSCGFQDLLRCSNCALSCAMWLLQTNEQFCDWAFSNSGLEVGLPAFQLPMFAKCDALPKGDLFDMFVKASIPAIPLGFQSSTPCQKEVYAPPALRYGCIMLIPSLQLQKRTCLMQRSRGFGHGVVVSKICYNAVIVLSVVLCDCCKPMNNCWDWAFSNSGLEVGCQPFSCRCSQMWRTAERRFVRHVCLRHRFRPFFLGFQASTPCQKQVPESGSTLQLLCIMLALCLQKIPSLCRRFRICFICRKA